MADLVVLYESAIGYALFDIKETEDIGIEIDSVQVCFCHTLASSRTQITFLGDCSRPFQVWKSMQAEGDHAFPLRTGCLRKYQSHQ